MKTKKIRKMKKQGWVTSTGINEPKGTSKFENEVKRLGLSSAAKDTPLDVWVEKNLKTWENSEELRIWVTRHYNDRYVPERLLRTWCLRPTWEDNALRWADSTVPVAPTKPKHEPGYYTDYDDNEAVL